MDRRPILPPPLSDENTSAAVPLAFHRGVAVTRELTAPAVPSAPIERPRVDTAHHLGAILAWLSRPEVHDHDDSRWILTHLRTVVVMAGVELPEPGAMVDGDAAQLAWTVAVYGLAADVGRGHPLGKAREWSLRIAAEDVAGAGMRLLARVRQQTEADMFVPTGGE